MLEMYMSGARVAWNGLFHCVNLCSAIFSEEDEKYHRGFWTNKKWRAWAKEGFHLTIDIFLNGWCDYDNAVYVGSVTVELFKERAAFLGFEVVMLPEKLVATSGVDPNLLKFNGEMNSDGTNLYGVGMVRNDTQLQFVTFQPGLGSLIYGGQVGFVGGGMYAAVGVTAATNFFLGTNSEPQVPYEESKFVKVRKFFWNMMVDAMKKMASGVFARERQAAKGTAAERSEIAQRREASRTASRRGYPASGVTVLGNGYHTTSYPN